jgi:hydroxymethylbilane synthase
MILPLHRLVLGTRGSDLALAQARLTATLLRNAHPDLEVEECIIKTTGDLRLDVALSNPGALDKGLFTKELEVALLDRRIDIAVHSLKDLPTEQPEGLMLGAILPREDPSDLLLSKHPGGVDGLPQGAGVATGSLRRQCFLRAIRSDLILHEIRGNVPTRIKKLHAQPELDGIVLAAAGLRRLQASGCPLALDGLHLTEIASMLPAPGQGAVAVQCRVGDAAVLEKLSAISDASTAVSVDAERAVLAGLGGGCHMPLGVRAQVREREIALAAGWFRSESEPPRMATASGNVSDWPAVVRQLLHQLYGN